MTANPTSRGIPRHAWAFAARRAWHGFVRHRGIDSAAALTFFASLAFFPASLAVVSVLAITAGSNADELLLSILDEVLEAETVETIRAPLDALLTVSNPGIALAIGLGLSLWSLATYATAFGRAVNTAYEVQEGRQIWRFRALMLGVSAFLSIGFAVILGLLLTTPRIAAAIAGPLGIGEPWLSTYSVGRWLLALALVTLVVAVLYYATPNVRHERFRWVSHGAIFAIAAWALATAGFALYVTTAAPYDRIYGWLGGGLVLLLWGYLTNLVLVLGAEVDVEVMRLRQLYAGIPAEEDVRVRLRDTRRNRMLARQRAADERDGKRLREEAESQGAPAEE